MLHKYLFLTETEDKRKAVNNKPKSLCMSWSECRHDYKIIEFYFILFIFNNLCQIDPRSAHSSFLRIKWVYKWDTGNSGEFGKLIKQIIKCDKCVALQWAETSLCSGMWGTAGAGEEYRSVLWLCFLKSTNNSNHLLCWTKSHCGPSIIWLESWSKFKFIFIYIASIQITVVSRQQWLDNSREKVPFDRKKPSAGLGGGGPSGPSCWWPAGNQGWGQKEERIDVHHTYKYIYSRGNEAGQWGVLAGQHTTMGWVIPGYHGYRARSSLSWLAPQCACESPSSSSYSEARREHMAALYIHHVLWVAEQGKQKEIWGC